MLIVITLFDLERRLHNVGAVCSEDKTEIIDWKVKKRHHRQHTLTTSLMESDLLANSFWLEFKNFKIEKEETKNGRENTNMKKTTSDSEWIDIWLIFLSRWVWLSSYSLDDSLFRNTLFMFGWNVLNTQKMKITR